MNLRDNLSPNGVVLYDLQVAVMIDPREMPEAFQVLYDAIVEKYGEPQQSALRKDQICWWGPGKISCSGSCLAIRKNRIRQESGDGGIAHIDLYWIVIPEGNGFRQLEVSAARSELKGMIPSLLKAIEDSWRTDFTQDEIEEHARRYGKLYGST